MSTFEVKYDFGYGMIPRDIMRSKKLSIQAKAIYAYLASFAGSSWKAYPSVDLMLLELGISKNTYYKYMNELKDNGAITVTRQTKKDGTFGKNIYYLQPRLNSSDMVKPDMVKPDMENSDTNSNSINSNSINSNNVVNANKFYQDNFGMITPYISDCIQGMVDELGEDMTIEAMKVALKNNVPKIQYAESCLYNWAKLNIRTPEDLKSHELGRQNKFLQGNKERTGRAKSAKETQKLIDDMWGDD